MKNYDNCRNNKLFIYIISISILFLPIIILYILGNIPREGYISDFQTESYNMIKTLELNGLGHLKNDFIVNNKINEDKLLNYILTNKSITNYSYGFKIKYHTKVFKNSDIYGVYPNSDKALKENSFIKYITNVNGSPFGELISTKIINSDEKYNIEYKLNIKIGFLIYILIIFIYISIIFFIRFLIEKDKQILYVYESKQLFSDKVYIILLIIIFILASFIRIHYASNQKDIYWDEYATLICIFSQDYDTDHIGSTLDADMSRENNNLHEYFKDISIMYKYTHDPYISNFYYSLLRTALIFRFNYSIEEIILIGTILNICFFLVSYIFMYKLLRMLIKDKDIVLFSMLCISLIPSSITFSMFLRPYQLQESLFIFFSYLIICIYRNNKLSFKYFVLTSLSCSFLYLTLVSSIIFVFILSIFIFMLFLIEINRKNIYFNIKKLMFFASSFVIAFPLSQIFYNSFFNSLLISNDRARVSFKFPENVLGYINYLGFVDILLYLIIFVVFYILLSIFRMIKNKNTIKFNMDIFYLIIIVFVALLFTIYSNINAPFNIPRYCTTSFPIIFLSLPLFLYFIKEKYIRYMLMLIISIIYIYNITTPKNFDYYEDVKSYYSVDNLLLNNGLDSINIYVITGRFGYYNNSILGGTGAITFKKMKSYEELKKNINMDSPSNFFVINNLDLNLNMNSNFIDACYGYTNIRKTYRNRYIFEFEKIKDEE
ncbi:hypothetical protein [Brachyspira alvinipulli]|uniref:hypothetical protein n=1 Tax=Brachyspira alvinipulli TaxID=84379 RepID=UPI000488ADF9|nr:hypothetical protein [Brachyspira alvinipulli]